MASGKKVRKAKISIPDIEWSFRDFEESVLESIRECYVSDCIDYHEGNTGCENCPTYKSQIELERMYEELENYYLCKNTTTC